MNTLRWLVVAAFLLMLILALALQIEQYDKCKEGVLVRGVVGYVCVERSR